MRVWKIFLQVDYFLAKITTMTFFKTGFFQNLFPFKSLMVCPSMFLLQQMFTPANVEAGHMYNMYVY